jgi:Matrixin
METTTRNALLLTAGILAYAVGAQAYSFLGPKWAVREVPYYINPVNSDISESDAIAAIQAGANAWATQSSANILPSYKGRTSGSTISLNGRSEIFFRESSAGSLYGETYWWWDSNNHLLEADTIYHASSVGFYVNPSACSGTGVYLQDASTHEFGHTLGLGHSSVSGASMYPTLTWCSTYVRTLAADDVAGIEALYPRVYTAPAAPTQVRIVR